MHILDTGWIRTWIAYIKILEIYLFCGMTSTSVILIFWSVRIAEFSSALRSNHSQLFINREYWDDPDNGGNGKSDSENSL